MGGTGAGRSWTERRRPAGSRTILPLDHPTETTDGLQSAENPPVAAPVEF
jgi:hypothetical protein